MSFAETWVRNTFSVEAVRVTEENMQKVANWCDGRIYGRQNLNEPLKLYVQFDAVGYSKHYAAKAFVGDWVIRVDGHFKHYTDNSFRRAYTKKTNKRESVALVVEKALTVRGADLEALTQLYTNKIIAIFGEEIQ